MSISHSLKQLELIVVQMQISKCGYWWLRHFMSYMWLSNQNGLTKSEAVILCIFNFNHLRDRTQNETFNFPLPIIYDMGYRAVNSTFIRFAHWYISFCHCTVGKKILIAVSPHFKVMFSNFAPKKQSLADFPCMTLTKLLILVALSTDTA